MVQRFGAPYFGKLGDATPGKDLTVGVFDNEIRRIVAFVNTSTSAVVSYKRGQIFARGVDGVTSPLRVVEVEDEAVGSGDGTETVFELDHKLVLPTTLALEVNSVAVTTGFTLDAIKGTLTFTAAVTNSHAIVATYDYLDAPGIWDMAIPLIGEVDVTVPKKVGDVNGTETLNVLVKAEVAKDMIHVGVDDEDFTDIEAPVRGCVENWLTLAGLVPADVVR